MNEPTTEELEAARRVLRRKGGFSRWQKMTEEQRIAEGKKLSEAGIEARRKKRREKLLDTGTVL